ncbi:WD40-repeat-containing domain protein [Mycena rosella]|uniref:WD40-repeat-containing domain protein n=1 Tax=Mycena rosella TaxID=1033263 RepID=A0AAD7DXD2_MYCRO|nr:WD40-repeat-containing domain protein [Mycena rosella]
MDPTLSENDYPFVCRSSVLPGISSCLTRYLGHLANIFNVKMLPHSSNIATVAGDGQVRVHQVGEIATSGPPATAQLSSRDTCLHRLRCHERRVKRIEMEDSPHLFLTAAEDGTVRQHDLRVAHSCSDYGSCPPPLLRLNFELSSLSLSPLTPFQLVVAGESAYGYLFDRRHAGRFLLEERGMVENGMTHCIRRFGRPASPAVDIRSNREHITGCRMSTQNGHEVLVPYAADAVYLYSTLDQPMEEDSMASAHPSSANNDHSKPMPPTVLGDDSSSTTDDDMDLDIDENASEEENERLIANLDEFVSRDAYSRVPLILPRTRFAGARNVETIKDVNFLGPDDEYVTSGSDDGNFFIWRKDGSLHGLFEGDGSVVNVIEPHPHLPLLATSGIDTTVKLFAPVSGPSTFSRMDSAARIIESNARQSRSYRKLRRHDFTALLAAVTADESPQCSHQ